MVIATRIQIGTRCTNLVLIYFKIAPSNPKGNKFLAAATTIIGPVLPAKIIPGKRYTWYRCDLAFSARQSVAFIAFHCSLFLECHFSSCSCMVSLQNTPSNARMNQRTSTYIHDGRIVNSNDRCLHGRIH